MARQAMVEHERLAMPFEKARTQLLLGQILRRRKQYRAAAETISAALTEFERIGVPPWIARARNELDRSGAESSDGRRLTPAEHRIAERAAKGMSNREIGAELYVTVKTVETTLGNAYRKLGIRSRSQLHTRLAALADPDHP